MDQISRYYMRKANLKVKDEFHDCINPADLSELRWARAYIFICPLFALGFVHFLIRIREEGGFARHFRSVISKARKS